MTHPAEVDAKIGALIDSLDAFELAFLQAATLECKSVLMAVALLTGRLTFTEATLLSRLEEEFQVHSYHTVTVNHHTTTIYNHTHHTLTLSHSHTCHTNHTNHTNHI